MRKIFLQLILLSGFLLSINIVDASTSKEQPTEAIKGYEKPIIMEHYNSSYRYDGSIYATGYVGEYNEYYLTHYFVGKYNITSSGSVANSLGFGYTKRATDVAIGNTYKRMTERVSKNQEKYKKLGIYESSKDIYYESGKGSGTSYSSATSYFENAIDYSFGLNHSIIIDESGCVWSAGFSDGVGRRSIAQISKNLSVVSSPIVTMEEQTATYYCKTNITSNAIMVDAGSNHTLILKNDGSIWAGGPSGLIGSTEDSKDEFIEIVSSEEVLNRGGIIDFSAANNSSFILYGNGDLYKCIDNGWELTERNVSKFDIDYDGNIILLTNNNEIKVGALEDLVFDVNVVPTNYVKQVRAGLNHWGYLDDDDNLNLYNTKDNTSEVIQNVTYFDIGSDTYGYVDFNKDLYMYGDERWIGGSEGLQASNINAGIYSKDEINLYKVNQHNVKESITSTDIYSPNIFALDCNNINLLDNHKIFIKITGQNLGKDTNSYSKNQSFYNEFIYSEDVLNNPKNYFPNVLGEYEINIYEENEKGNIIGNNISFEFRLLEQKISDNSVCFEDEDGFSTTNIRYNVGIKYYLRIFNYDDLFNNDAFKVEITIENKSNFNKSFVYYNNGKIIDDELLWDYMPRTESGEYKCIVILTHVGASGEKYVSTSETNFNLKIYKEVEEPEDQEYKVTYINDTYQTEVTVNSENLLVEPTPPTKEGYKFLGWYINDTKYNFQSEVVSDLILTAKWEKIEDTVEPPVEPDIELEQEVMSKNQPIGLYIAIPVTLIVSLLFGVFIGKKRN